MRFHLPLLAASALAAFLLASCATRPIETRPPPRAIELRDEPQVSTFHFPRGLYTFAESDESGFYYRAPRRIIKHGFPGSIQYEGGLFVPKPDRRKLRAYVIWAGGRTKIGNLSRADYELID